MVKYRILITKPNRKIGDVSLIWKKITIKEQGQINCINNIIRVYFDNNRDKYDIVRTAILMYDTPERREYLYTERKRKKRIVNALSP